MCLRQGIAVHIGLSPVDCNILFECQVRVVGLQLAGDRAIVQMIIIACFRIVRAQPIRPVEPKRRATVTIEGRWQFGAAFGNRGNVACPPEVVAGIGLAKLEHQRRTTGLATAIGLDKQLGLVIRDSRATLKHTCEHVIAHKTARRLVFKRFKRGPHRGGGSCQFQCGGVQARHGYRGRCRNGQLRFQFFGRKRNGDVAERVVGHRVHDVGRIRNAAANHTVGIGHVKLDIGCRDVG